MKFLSRRASLRLGLLSLSLSASPVVARGTSSVAAPVVLLRDVVVAGEAYYRFHDVAPRLRTGDALVLRREPQNRFDALAIEVLAVGGEKLGYVPRRCNEAPARMMDAGRTLVGVVSAAALTPVRTGHPGATAWRDACVLRYDIALLDD